MPIRIQNDLPAKEILEKKIFSLWMRAVHSARRSDH